MIEKQSDAVSPKVADVLEKVMSQAAEGQTGRPQETLSPRLIPTAQQRQLPPPTFSSPSRASPPSSERLPSAGEATSPGVSPSLDMVTSAQAPEKEAGGNLHYFRSDHDSLSSSESEFGYDDDDVFLNRRQTSGLASNNTTNSSPRDAPAMPSHHAYFSKHADDETSDGEKNEAGSKDSRMQEHYAQRCSQNFPDGNSPFSPFSALHPDFSRVGLFGPRGSSERLYPFGQPRVAPLICGQPSLKDSSPPSPRLVDSNHGNHNSSVSSSTDNGLYNVRYAPPTYKSDVTGPDVSSVTSLAGSAPGPLQTPGMRFPLTPGRMGPFPPLSGAFGGGGGGMIMSPPSGLQQAPFMARMGPGMQPIMTNSAGHVYFCHICEYSGPTKEEFDQHMVVHFGYRCPHCDYTSRTEGRLKRHIKDFHTDSESKQRAAAGRPKVYRCKQCEFSCTNKVEFWEHARTHIKEDKLLQCPTCPFVTEYRHHLEYHLRNHFGSKPYKCGKCNYSCVNRSMLNSHMKSHTNVYQYRCADCTYATKYCHSLKLHLRKHRHQPAAVLNSDGSLPQGIDAKMSGLSLMAKRGPPRGPRGLRKEKDSPNSGPEPLMSGLFPLGHPLHPAEALSGMDPVINGALMAAARYWPLVPNSMHPPPPLIPIVTGLGSRGQQHHAHPVLTAMERPSRSGQVLEREPQAERDGSPADRFKCNHCSFVSDAAEQLEYHVMKAHEVRTSDLLGRRPANAPDEQAVKLQARRMSAPPPACHPPTSTSLAVQADTMYRRNSSSDTGCAVSLNGLASHFSEDGVSRSGSLPKPDYQFGSPEASHAPPNPQTGYRSNFIRASQSLADDQAQGEQQGVPEGADILRQMALKFGPSLSSSSSSSSPPLMPAASHQPPRSTPVSTAATTTNISSSQASGPTATAAVAKDSPLDLTNKLKSVSPSPSHSPSPPLSMSFEGGAPSTGPGGQHAMKRNLPDGLAASSEDNSCSGGDAHASSPRKRSRKGKAYKLEALCLKLQEKQTSSPPYQSDSNESDPTEGQSTAPRPASTAAVVSSDLGALDKEKIPGQKSAFCEGLEDGSYSERVVLGGENAEVQTISSQYEGLQNNLRLLNSHEEQAENVPVAALERFHLNKPPFSMPRQDASSSPPQLPSPADGSNTTTGYHHVEPEREKALVFSDIYHHRRKPVTPALRRGAEVAWKILQDPVTPTLQAEAKGDLSRPLLSLPPARPPSPKYRLGGGGGCSSPPPLTRDAATNGFGIRAAPQRLSTHAQTVQPLPACMEEFRQHAARVGESYECSYCDITFRESVMHAVHMGFHGYQDPFKCNMCGQVSKDKFEFFLHIARTAHN